MNSKSPRASGSVTPKTWSKLVTKLWACASSFLASNQRFENFIAFACISSHDNFI
ncbi:MAG: hypothetical protein FWC97_03420 [Treponema sp.]|nr:hypothetical protein [Treponema sp.]